MSGAAGLNSRKYELCNAEKIYTDGEKTLSVKRYRYFWLMKCKATSVERKGSFKMPAKMRIFLFLMMNLVFAFSALAQDAHKQVAEGNKLYQEGKYDEANNRYRDALVASPESPIINFNIGNVLYKKRNYEESVNAYEKVLSAEDVKLQAQSYYNLGNTHFRMGKLPESILYYKKAIKLNPKDEDAKYNLEYVRAKLKDEANKQQHQNQNLNQDQQQNQQHEQQNQQDQEQKQNQEGQDEQDESGQQQQEKQDQREQRQEEQSQEQQQQSPQQQEISREDAERLLNAVQNEEQDLLKDNRRKVRAQGAFRGKDW